MKITNPTLLVKRLIILFPKLCGNALCACAAYAFLALAITRARSRAQWHDGKNAQAHMQQALPTISALLATLTTTCLGQVGTQGRASS